MKRYLIIFTCLIVSLFSWSALAASQDGSKDTNNNKPTKNISFTPDQVKEVQKIIYHYLINNPEVLLKVSQALQEKQAAQSQKDAMSAIKGNGDRIFSDPKSPTVGNPSGSIEIVEFFDYQCGHCKTVAPVIEAAIKKNPNIKVIFKELPIFGGNSSYAAKAALASVAQGKYYAFHNALFSSKNQLDPQVILNLAKKEGINVTQLQRDMDLPWIAKQIRDNFQLAQALKLMGTPAFIISNKEHTKLRFIPGATSQDDFNRQIADVSQ